MKRKRTRRFSRWSDLTIVDVFALGERIVNTLPEPVGRIAFEVGGALAGLMPLHGVNVLRMNQARLSTGTPGSRLLSARAMASYMRYYYEVLHFSSLSADNIRARVRITGVQPLRDELAAGHSIVGALAHMGNWDMIGAYAQLELGSVHTIAEKLNPPELFDFFARTRAKLGMTIYPLAEGEHPLDRLMQAMGESPILAVLLADRDLSSNGVEVSLAGHSAMVAPGPALLAQRRSSKLFPIAVFYRKLKGEEKRRAGSAWGIEVRVCPPTQTRVSADASPAARRADVARMTQYWVSALEPYLREHVEDWHMLQRVFVRDLDRERLARTRRKAAQRAAREDQEYRERLQVRKVTP
ncbi:MAG: phosphatidylinositol mannoside acyltransferase [Actinomycetaceae bacterium]|nr:phosphatidylinositol mannoside acyltransferase [Actinomycetaceae bacterium]MDY6083272.1 phosphatidylinositol mannoside acyltransferase [Actinomycetaceae bacterium]